MLAQHAPMVCALGAGIVSVDHEAAKKYFVVYDGVLEVGSDECILLADHAEVVANVEEAKGKLSG